MNTPLFAASLAVPLAAALLLSACQAPPAPPAPTRAAATTLPAFADDQALAAAFERARAGMVTKAPPPPPLPPLPQMSKYQAQAKSADAAADAPQLSPPAPAEPAAPAADAITNVQTVGVDEGDIVKKQGDILIVLRRGRLFTLDTSGDGLRAVSTVDAFAPGSSVGGAWYDEMLVADGTVVVLGYSYERGGTEIGLFDLDAGGGLRYRATYHLRSNDYYSSSNYASRLIGKTLILYAPMQLYGYDAKRPEASLPALRRWQGGAAAEDFQRILPASRIYYTPAALDDGAPTLHTLTLCDLAGARMQCRSSAVLGAHNRSFYVSNDAVYVWTVGWPEPEAPPRPEATVYRLPLDGGAPSALRASGAPVDQMSFLERDGWLNVLVGSHAEGDGMWRAHADVGALSLLRVRLSEFGDGRGIARREAYRALPEASGIGGALHARYIGDWLVFGFGDYWGEPGRRPGGAYALRYAERGPVAQLPLAHRVERVDALGGHAIAVGGDLGDAPGGGLHFSSLRLDRSPSVAGHYLQPQSQQGDQRSHGFFYRAEDAEHGELGLPVIGPDPSGTPRARVLFLHNRRLNLSPAGELASGGQGKADGCVVSCVDWYGNARPIFAGPRVFALLGYELVEGRRENGRIVERRRIDFTPQAAVSR